MFVGTYLCNIWTPHVRFNHQNTRSMLQNEQETKCSRYLLDKMICSKFVNYSMSRNGSKFAVLHINRQNNVLFKLLNNVKIGNLAQVFYTLYCLDMKHKGWLILLIYGKKIKITKYGDWFQKDSSDMHIKSSLE